LKGVSSFKHKFTHCIFFLGKTNFEEINEKEMKTMSNNDNTTGMSKKLRQAVQHANETTPSSRSRNKPNTPSSDKRKFFNKDN
jgi:isopentenyl phosphate kinase